MDIERGFVKLKRSNQATELMKDPKAFTLLAQIASRAKRTNEVSVYGLEVGEALIGDYKSCGITEKEYRNRKKRLEKMGLASFRGTSEGTIAKLINSDVFDINPEERGEQKGEQRANKGRLTRMIRMMRMKRNIKAVRPRIPPRKTGMLSPSRKNQVETQCLQC